MISQTAEYALRAIVYLASRGGVAQTTTQISEATQVPASYLAKVMQSLGRAGIVKSQRGLKGGFTLTHRPEDVSLLTVVSAVDPMHRYAGYPLNTRSQGCPLGIGNHGREMCPLHRRLDDAASQVEQAPEDTTVAQLVALPQ